MHATEGTSWVYGAEVGKVFIKSKRNIWLDKEWLANENHLVGYAMLQLEIVVGCL